MNKEQHKQMNEQAYLSQYAEEQKQYEKPSVTVDIAIFGIGDKEEVNPESRKRAELALKVLLVKRGQHPEMGKWAMVGGFMDINETLEEAVVRELGEEVGVTDVYMEQLYTWSDVERDKRMRILSASYVALVNRAKHEPIANDDVDEAKWFTLQEVQTNLPDKTVKDKGRESISRMKQVQLQFTSEDGEDSFSVLLEHEKNYGRYGTADKYTVIENNALAFDHAKILYYSLMRLRNKVGYTDIIFDLMPEKFTLSMLKEVYDILQGERSNPVTFKRLMLDKLNDIKGEKYTKGYRPATLYKYDPFKSFENQQKKR